MKPIEIKNLIAGIMTLLGVAVALGKLDQVHDYARTQAIRSLKGWDAHPFFPNKANAVSRPASGRRAD